MNEWNIQSRASACEACGQPFADRQKYHTLLLDEKEGLRRMDICDPCWQKKQADGDVHRRAGFISFWQGIFEAPAAQPADAIQKETAETILRKLIEQNDPNYAPAAFILAVMLERKRILRVKEQFQREGRRVFIYEQPKTGDLFTISDPDLHLDQLEQVQRDVAQLLEHGLPPPAPDAPAPENPVAEAPASETPAPVAVSENPPANEPSVEAPAAEPAVEQ
jgi:hypothetical protein